MLLLEVWEEEEDELEEEMGAEDTHISLHSGHSWKSDSGNEAIYRRKRGEGWEGHNQTIYSGWLASIHLGLVGHSGGFVYSEEWTSQVGSITQQELSIAQVSSPPGA